MTTNSSDRSALSPDGGRVSIWWGTVVERFRTSLFGVPALWIAAAVLGSYASTRLDQTGTGWELPGFLDTTVASARSILAAVSSGTITAASVVFSLTLVSIQLSTSAYSSRVLRSFLRDRFQQHMIGVVTATFLYSLLVLREVRGPLEEGGDAYIPRFSVFIAVVFATVAVLALIASISHTAQQLRVSSVTRELTDELITLIHNRLPEPSSTRPDSRVTLASASVADPQLEPHEVEDPDDASFRGAVVTADRRGWVQQLSLAALSGCLPEGSTVRVEAMAGDYVMHGSPLAVVWPAPDADSAPAIQSALRGAFSIGAERTMQQDISFGIMTLEDVAVKALSPGVNAPNTAIAVMTQLAEVVLNILERELPPTSLEIAGRRITSPYSASNADYVRAAFDQIRLYSRGQPPLQKALVEAISSIDLELARRRRSTTEAREALQSMIASVIEDMEHESRPGTGDRAAVAALGAAHRPTPAP